MTPRLTVFACGNTSRGDDALGPCLLRRLDGEQLPDVTTIEAFQLQIEHALDMDDADLTLFLDAGTGTGTAVPIAFYEVQPRGAATVATHALEPAVLLDVYRKALDKPPPAAFVLYVRGERFGLGEGISEVATEGLETAWPLLRNLCANPDVERWRRLAALFAVVAD